MLVAIRTQHKLAVLVRRRLLDASRQCRLELAVWRLPDSNRRLASIRYKLIDVCIIIEEPFEPFERYRR